MARRKELAANERKEAMKTTYIAKLRNVPTSPRKKKPTPITLPVAMQSLCINSL